MGYWQVSLFAMLLAAAGLPLYIHLPRYATAQMGLDLSTVGGILIGLRVVDFVQDPFLGRLIDRFPRSRAGFAALALATMALGFVMLFTLSPPVAPVPWLVLSLVVVFTGFSLGSILFYGQSLALAGSREGLIGLAGWREAGTLAGIVLAAIAPVLLAPFDGRGGYAFFGLGLAVAAVLVWGVTRGLWRPGGTTQGRLDYGALWSAGGGRLLLLAFVNSLPVAMTSTLFLFFVEDRLMLGGLAGPFLILFFVASGLSVPLWTVAARRVGTRRVLLFSMSLAILSFGGAALLPEGAAMGFALICVGSGAALGADMVILPALFAALMGRAGQVAGQAFGLWSLAGKLALAVAAVALLPLLDWSGFRPGGANDARGLLTLTLAYAVIPCLIKLVAIWMVARLSQEVEMR
ncbi:sodium:galactoside symporter [Aquicoccus porphyridii]|uniref:Sodium:galactoside symporter n=1 Tax=Aquicoccus porphyridii TaxID=1852029 RepID=A0A5A9ZT40_9RHOB|nr:MFS transporter [Aquicoccus porphyridii]KAA0920241.1 sodium:galactoside symporter [Aquicoccus porphyridii]RAI54961.1 sodium:galactoside symporter [Rhodobacteraceae bacterium AsT-22]